MHLVLRLVIHARNNQMPQRGLLAKHQKLCFYLQASSMFPTLPEGSVEYYILSENRIVDSKKCYQKLYI